MIDAAGLRVMRAIADEGSFTGAAASLGYSQPAVSQMVRRLELRSGTVLVKRIGRNVRLTEAGQVLARHAVGVLAALDAAEEEVAAIAGLRSGRVRLMAFPSSSASLVPRALALVKKRFPDVRVTFGEGGERSGCQHRSPISPGAVRQLDITSPVYPRASSPGCATPQFGNSPGC